MKDFKTKNGFFTGNVGIGTTSPGKTLHIAANAHHIALEDTNGTAGSKMVGIYNNNQQLHLGRYSDDNFNDFTTDLFINASGNVGIGTTSPTTKLHVDGIGKFDVPTGGSTLFSWSQGQTTNVNQPVIALVTNEANNQDRVRLDSDGDSWFNGGKVGIGTTSPIAELDVYGFGKLIGITSTHADTTRITHASLQADTNGWGSINAYNNVGNPIVRLNSNGDSYLNGGNVGIGTTNPAGKLDVQGGYSFLNTLRINGAADTATIWKANGDMTIYPQAGSLYLGGAGTSQLMTLTSSNVGIGTTNPSQGRLVTTGYGGHSNTRSFVAITHNNNVESYFRIARMGSGDSTSVSLANNYNRDVPAYQADDNTAGISDITFRDDGGLSFSTGAVGTTQPVEKMRIAASGNVGIGTTNPGVQRLHVQAGTQQFVQEIRNTNTTSAYGLYVQFDTAHDNKISEFIRCSTNGNNNINFRVYSDGTIFADGASLGSDDRIKHNEEKIVNAIETLSKITPKKYFKTTKLYEANHDFDLDSDGNPIDESGEPVKHRVEAGVIAQEVLGVDELKFAVSPETKDEDGNITTPYALNYNSLFTYAIAAIQEQQTIIEDLKARIETLES